MRILEFTNYTEQAQAHSLQAENEFVDPYAPFKQADGSAQLREFSKIWTVGYAVLTVGLTTLGYSFDWNTLWFPVVSGGLWKGFTVQHNNNAEVAEKLLAEYKAAKKE